MVWFLDDLQVPSKNKRLGNVIIPLLEKEEFAFVNQPLNSLEDVDLDIKKLNKFLSMLDIKDFNHTGIMYVATEGYEKEIAKIKKQLPDFHAFEEKDFDPNERDIFIGKRPKLRTSDYLFEIVLFEGKRTHTKYRPGYQLDLSTSNTADEIIKKSVTVFGKDIFTHTRYKVPCYKVIVLLGACIGKVGRVKIYLHLGTSAYNRCVSRTVLLNNNPLF